MSNFSEDTSSTEVDGGFGHIQRLLQVMKQEWSALAEAISGLGETLSAGKEVSGGAQMVREMQAFDSLKQRAHAQARLLDRICHELAARDGPALSSLETLIEEVPFLEMRRRLFEALKGRHSVSHPEPAHGDEEAVHWFG